MILQPLLDAVLVDIGGTVVDEAPPGTAAADLDVHLRPGAYDALVAIAAQVALGAVTNTATMTESDVRAVLEPSGISALLRVLVTSVDVGVGKPDPEPLTVALAGLGLSDPTRVLYVGDRPTDAEAAKSAGMAYADSAGRSIAEAVTGWIERTAGSRFEAARGNVRPVDTTAAAAADTLQQRLTKPPGALGRLESAGTQLAAIAGASPPPIPEPAVVAVFAGDHGVLDAGVSAWPQEVTAQMVANFSHGGAAINVLARHAGAEVQVIDVGVATPLLSDDGVLRRNVGRGTADLSVGPAMTRTQTLLALDVGVDVATGAVSGGARCLLTGDMGIGNTTPSAALIAAVTGLPATDVTGRGAGADDAVLGRKIDAIERALDRVPATAGMITQLTELGGFEIAALAGFIVGGAASGVPVVIDGVVAAAAALVATSICPPAQEYLVAGHRSVEPGASAALSYLGLEPLLDLELRLGEGSGAALALPVLQAAAKILNEMATFDSAGVTEK